MRRAKGGHLLNARKRSEGRGDGRGNPDKVRQLQIALYRKAKAEPRYRFWSLYGEVQRRDVLEAALKAQLQNNGAAGVDGDYTDQRLREHHGLYELPITAAWKATR